MSIDAYQHSVQSTPHKQLVHPTVWQAGNKTKWTWALSGFNQVLWFTWIVTSKNWNFLFMNVALTVIYIRNHRKWNQSQEKPA